MEYFETIDKFIHGRRQWHLWALYVGGFYSGAIHFSINTFEHMIQFC